jgi:hypothetical protein
MYFWPFVSAGLAVANLASRLLTPDGGMFVKKSGSGHMVTFAPVYFDAGYCRP